MNKKATAQQTARLAANFVLLKESGYLKTPAEKSAGLRHLLRRLLSEFAVGAGRKGQQLAGGVAKRTGKGTLRRPSSRVSSLAREAGSLSKEYPNLTTAGVAGGAGLGLAQLGSNVEQQPEQ